MKIGELIKKLEKFDKDTEVLIDTEAAEYLVHLVEIDDVLQEEYDDVVHIHLDNNVKRHDREHSGMKKEDKPIYFMEF